MGLELCAFSTMPVEQQQIALRHEQLGPFLSCMRLYKHANTWTTVPTVTGDSKDKAASHEQCSLVRSPGGVSTLAAQKAATDAHEIVTICCNSIHMH